MIITTIAVLIGLGIGLLRGGRISNLRGVNVVLWPVLAVGLVLQAAAESFDLPGALSISIIGMFLILVGLGFNSHIRGVGIAGFGVLLNLLVTVANGHVPIRFEAIEAAGLLNDANVTPEQVNVGGLGELETADTRLAILGDVIPLELFSTVISFGDLITLAGIIVIAQNLLESRHRVGISVDDLFGDEGSAPSGPTTPGSRTRTASAPTGASVIELDHTPPLDHTPAPANSEPSPLDLRDPQPVPEATPAGSAPFDYGEADAFDEGISTIRPLS